jgi:hypothetical protein
LSIKEIGGLYDGAEYYHGSRHDVEEELNAGHYYSSIALYYRGSISEPSIENKKHVVLRMTIDVDQNLDVGSNKVYYEDPDFDDCCEIKCDYEFFRKCGVVNPIHPIFAMVGFVRAHYPETGFRSSILYEVEKEATKMINRKQKEENHNILDDDLFIEEDFDSYGA